MACSGYRKAAGHQVMGGPRHPRGCRMGAGHPWPRVSGVTGRPRRPVGRPKAAWHQVTGGSRDPARRRAAALHPRPPVSGVTGRPRRPQRHGKAARRHLVPRLTALRNTSGSRKPTTPAARMHRTGGIFPAGAPRGTGRRCRPIRKQSLSIFRIWRHPRGRARL